MPAVVTYWAVTDDEQEFLSYLQKTGNIVAVSGRMAESRQPLCPEPVVSFIKQHNPAALWFGRGEDLTLDSIEAKEVGGKTMYALPYMRPNVIGYRRARFHDGKLCQSNLCAYWNYPDAAATRFIQKDESFVKWARRVLNWARRATPNEIELNGFPYRATKRAWAAFDAGEIDVIF